MTASANETTTFSSSETEIKMISAVRANRANYLRKGRFKICEQAECSSTQKVRVRAATLVFPWTTMLPSSGTRLALVRRMAEKSLEARVAAIEAELAGKTLQEYFREQAELIDRRFAYHFDEFDKKWEAKLDRKLGNFERSLEYRLGKKFDERFERIDVRLDAIEDAVKLVLTRLPESRKKR